MIKTNTGKHTPQEPHTKENCDKAPAVHTHDDRYYTESEINSLLNGKANSSHTHDDRYYTEAETDIKINAIKKIYQGEIAFSSGIGTVSIPGSEVYGIALAQNISSNEHCIYRVIHDLNSSVTTLVARKQDGNVFDGNLTVIIAFL